MKIYVGKKLMQFDSEKEPIIMAFDNDEQRLAVASQLSNMELKEGKRLYAQFPAGSDVATMDNMLDSVLSL